MKVLALISGGKDSIYNICCCIDKGHQIIALANLYNQVNGEEGSQLDSYMYQTVGTNVTLIISQALEKPIYRRPITGKPKIKSLEYKKQEGDQVEDLQQLVKDILIKHPEINAISSGAIFSTYQKLRVQDICKRHGLESLAYLWHRQQKQLLKEMIDYGMNAILIKVASYGLNKNHLGKSIAQLYPFFLKLNNQCQMNVCGQGGQYESLVIDCRYYKKRIVIKRLQVVEIQKNEISPVAYLKFIELELQQK